MLLNSKLEKEHFPIYFGNINNFFQDEKLSYLCIVIKIKWLYNYQVFAFRYNALPIYMYYLEFIYTFTFSSLKRHEIIGIICYFIDQIVVIR